jgi:hypothetical protein
MWQGVTIDPPKRLNADLPGVVELGSFVHWPRRNAHGATRGQNPWIVIVEPDVEAQLIVVVTVYEVSQ